MQSKIKQNLAFKNSFVNETIPNLEDRLPLVEAIEIIDIYKNNTSKVRPPISLIWTMKGW